MSSAIVSDKKYDEGKYRYKKEVVDISDINIDVGDKLYLDGQLYGTVIKESESFYYIKKETSEESYEFIKTSLKEKIVSEILRLEGSHST